MKKKDPLITQGRGWKNSTHLNYSVSYIGDVTLKNIIVPIMILYVQYNGVIIKQANIDS